MTMQQTDATPRGADGQAIPFEAPITASVVLEERKGPSETPEEPDPRDVLEDAAAERRLQQLEEQAAGNAEAEIVPRPKEDGTEDAPVEQPRDERGRFASPEPAATPVPQAAGPTIRFMVGGKPQEIPADAKIVVKVDGQEREITAGEWQKAAQIEAAARKRLGEANSMRADAERILQSVRQAPPAPQPAAPEPKKTEAAPTDREQLLSKFIEAVTYARAEEAQELGKQLIAVPAQQALTPEQIASIADARWAARNQEQRVESAIADVRDKHKEVFADQRLQAAVAAESQRLMAEDLVQLGADPRVLATLTPDQIGGYHREARRRDPMGEHIRPFETILSTAAASIHKDFVAPRSTPASQTTVAARHEAKRAASAPPAPATARPSPRAPTVKSAAQLIAEENADRGRGR